ncbi:MAG: hypothetical protein P8J37_04765 [Fuerstiella sp.]|nr:hypothetical protein [Fuerstiella sp.]
MFARPADFIAAAISAAIRWMVVASCLAGSVALAQEPEATESEATVKSTDLDTLEPGVHVIQKMASGRIYALPGFDLLMKEFLERARLQAFPPVHRIADVQISGVVGQELAELKADITVDIFRDGERVSVPVGFDDLQLKEHSHSSTLPDLSALPIETKLPRKEWIFQGLGRHKLQLSLIGPIRTATNGTRRLKVSAPKSGQSGLRLHFSETVADAELSTEGPFQLITDDATGKSELVTWGLTEDTEITWTPASAVENQIATVQATSPAQMTLDLTTEPASFRGTQALTVSGGSISELQIHLPNGFEPVTMTATDADGNSISDPTATVAETDDGVLVLRLESPATGAVILNYDFNLKDTAYPQNISVRMPDISSVSNESADVDIFVSGGLDIERPKEINVRRSRVESTRVGRTPALAYRLLSSESQVTLRISESEAFFAVAPHINFTTEQDNVHLKARFSVNMVRGSLNQLEIVWPNHIRDGWQILDGSTSLVSETGPAFVSGFGADDDVDKYTLVFQERQSGQFDIEVQAFRDLAGFKDGEGLMFLPDIKSSAPHSTIVSLVESDAYSMFLSPQNEQAAFPALPSNRWPLELQNQTRPEAWLLDNSDEAVRLRITQQKPEVRTSLLTSISVANESLHVREVLSYDVRFRDLSDIRLQLPDVVPTVRLSGFDDPLIPSRTEGRTVTYGLPKAMRGKFDLTIAYNWLPKETGSPNELQNLNLPLVLPATSGELLEHATVATNFPQTLVLHQAEDWAPVYSEQYAAAWRSETVPDTLPIVLKQPLTTRSENAPQFMVATTFFQAPDALITNVTAVFTHPSDTVWFVIDKTVKPLQGAMNNRPAAVKCLFPLDDAKQWVQLRAPNDAALDSPATVTLMVRHVVDKPDFGALSEVTLPYIAGHSDCNAIWILRQTEGHALVGLESTLTALNSNVISRLFPGSATDFVTATATILSPCEQSVREKVTDLLNRSIEPNARHELLAGSVGGPKRLLTVTSSAVLLGAALLCVLLYFLLLRLHNVPLTTVLTCLAVAVTTIVSLTPVGLHGIMLNLLPMCVIGVVAAAIQRFVGRTRPSLESISAADGSTIFAIEKPSFVEEQGVAPVSHSTIPSSKLSVT